MTNARAETLTLAQDATTLDMDLRVLDSMGLVVAEDLGVETGAGASVVLTLTPTETATWTVQVFRITGTTPSTVYHLQLTP